MSSEPIFLRWEHTTYPHPRFYELEVSLFCPKLLIRRWGRIGTRRPGSIRMVVADREHLQRQVGLTGGVCGTGTAWRSSWRRRGSR